MSAKDVVAAAKARGLKITAAESCTGGLVCAKITEIAGASAVFERGFVTYSNDVKHQVLNVSYSSLKDFGAVSEQVAAEMARGARHAAGADLAVAITGIAGPGGSDFKPEGRVCFAICDTNQKVYSETVEFGALGRSNVRNSASEHALWLVWRALMDLDAA